MEQSESENGGSRGSRSNDIPQSSGQIKSVKLSRSKSKGVQRATCSSALRHSKDVPCPFTYCSLHGHHHANVPQLKTLISIRRRLLKTQRGTKSPNRVKTWGKDHQTCCCKDDEKLFCETLDKTLQKTTDFAAIQQVLVSPTPPLSLCLNEGTDFTCFDKLKSIPDDVVELSSLVFKSTSDNESHEKSCASGFASSEKQNDGYLAVDQVCSLEELDKNENVECMQAKNHRYITMWKLMYKHAVKGSTQAVENPPSLYEEDKEDLVKGTTIVPLTNNPSVSETDEQTVPTDHECCQQKAIDIVQDAFDNILFPEVQGSLYDDQYVTSEISSDQDRLQRRIDEEVEHRTLNYGDSSMDRIIQNTGEVQIEAESTNATNVEAVEETEEKFEQNTPKRWSSLKKFILLKRFVKAIGKVRNLSYQTPHFLAVDTDPEAEKVHLHQQRFNNSKNSDEWMLDYALQKVICKLSLPQQRRVALLVEAFETVLPFHDIKTHPRAKPIGSTEAEPEASDRLYIQNGDEPVKECQSGKSARILLGCLSCPEEISMRSSLIKESSAEDWSTKQEANILASGATDDVPQVTQSIKIGNNEDTVFTNTNAEEFPSVFSSEKNSLRFCLETCSKQEEDGGTIYEVIENETAQGTPTEHICVTSADPLYRNPDVETSERYSGKFNTNNGAESDMYEETVVPLSPRTKTTRDGSNEGETNKNSGCFQGSPPPEHSHLESNGENVTQLEKQNYTRLWYFVYRHMVSNISEKDGDEPPDGTDKEQGNNTNTSLLAGTDSKLRMKNQNTLNKTVELHRIETIKLVEKAIDDILLLETQEESEDDLANTRDLVPDLEPPENNIACEGKYLSDFSNFAKDGFRESKKKVGEDQEELFLTTNKAFIKDDDKEVLMVEEEPKPKMSKNWKNLKKIILLNRFVKALEKGKKFSTRGPKFLLQVPDPEAEKVDLKHQNIDDRKNAEEWMLDYALQKAVAKLTPARSRKVALLVEAFETVIPNKGIPNPFKSELIY